MKRSSAPVSLQQRLAWSEVLLTLSIEAGQAIEAVRRRDGRAHRLKSDDSPVTQADLAANEILLKGLARLAPAIEVLSEEAHNPFRTGHPPAHPPAHYWAVDPLDGTREFISGSRDYTVNVALVEAGVPTLGVVHAPATGETWLGVAGWQAVYLPAHPGAHPDLGEATPIRVSSMAPGQLPAVVVSRTAGSPRIERMLAVLGCASRVPLGSSLKLCAVAQGRAHLYPRTGTTCIWDLAAGQAVLLAAGGVMLDLQARPLRFPDPTRLEIEGFVAAADEAIARRALNALTEPT
jgi:3'(2'), 5'-bisphosphate nucleotidase